MSRVSDSSPFTAGDQIVDDLDLVLAGCTAGFAITLPGNQQAALSAGHCVMYNDYPIFVLWNNTSLTNNPSGGNYFGYTDTYSTQGLDTQVIKGSNYSCWMWDSAAGAKNPTSEQITGYFDAPVGATIDNEGSFGGSHAGVVSAINQNEDIEGEYLQDLVIYSAQAVAGDSGGPVVYPTGYGPLAAGTIVAGPTSAPYYTYSEEIDALIYVLAYEFGSGFGFPTELNGCA
jgi:hypothetical protein